MTAVEMRTSTSYMVPPDDAVTDDAAVSPCRATRLKNLTARFIAGIKKYNLTYEQITGSDWKYCGGDRDAAARYYAVACPGEEHPEPKNRCVCNHAIKKNFYIINVSTKQILTLGMCCIKKFIPKSGRTCAECNAPHRNRRIDLCNVCASGLCLECHEPKWNTQYKLCYECWRDK